MASSYRGLFIQKTADGLIHSVQVVDTAGISIPLDPNTYLQRDVHPPIETLPDVLEYELLQKIHKSGSQPAPETEQHKRLINNGYLRQVTRRIENIPGTDALVGHELTDKGLSLIK